MNLIKKWPKIFAQTHDWAGIILKGHDKLWKNRRPKILIARIKCTNRGNKSSLFQWFLVFILSFIFWKKRSSFWFWDGVKFLLFKKHTKIKWTRRYNSNRKIRIIYKTEHNNLFISQAIIVSFEHVNWHSNNQWQRLIVRSIWSCFGISKMFFLYSMYTVTNSLQISGACSALLTRQNCFVSMSIFKTGLFSSLMPSLSIFFPHPYSLRHSLKKIT